MSLKQCRACKKEVDTSAISCPNCGATRPAHALSLQTYNLIILAVQIIVGLVVLYFVASAVWEKAEPYINKSGIMHQQSLNNFDSNSRDHNEEESVENSDNETSTANSYEQ